MFILDRVFLYIYDNTPGDFPDSVHLIADLTSHSVIGVSRLSFSICKSVGRLPLWRKTFNPLGVVVHVGES